MDFQYNTKTRVNGGPSDLRIVINGVGGWPHCANEVKTVFDAAINQRCIAIACIHIVATKDQMNHRIICFICGGSTASWSISFSECYVDWILDSIVCCNSKIGLWFEKDQARPQIIAHVRGFGERATLLQKLVWIFYIDIGIIIHIPELGHYCIGVVSAHLIWGSEVDLQVPHNIIALTSWTRCSRRARDICGWRRRSTLHVKDLNIGEARLQALNR